MPQPRTARTFDEYLSTVYAPYILKRLETTRRADLDWDVYQDDSLKRSLREKRGSGQGHNIQASTRIPAYRKGFLQVVLSQILIFILLKAVSLKVPEGKCIYSTYNEGILSSTERTEMSLLAPCTHEEEDTRLTVHVLDATSSGHRWNRIRNKDTDVVVLVISVASTLPTDELWITYGSRKNVQNIPAMSLGSDKASTLSMFHAPNGCDTVSSFRGRGKKTARDVWNLFS